MIHEATPEGLKIDVWTVGGIPMARWITGITLVISVVVMAYRHFRHRPRFPDEVV